MKGLIPPVSEVWRDKVDHTARYQSDLKISDLFPIRDDGLCACGCDGPLTGRRTRWASTDCNARALNTFWIIKGDSGRISYWLSVRDKGVCAQCGEQKPWEADHIIPVSEGGGGCNLDGYQTLCGDCHKEKTKGMRQDQRIRMRNQSELWA